jgi:hypothetical protein
METRTFALAAASLLLMACGGHPAVTPTTVTGLWQLTAVDGAQGGTIPADNVLQLGLDPGGGVRYVSCLDPVFEGTALLTCREQLVCATGTYTFDGTTLTLHQTGNDAIRQGTVTFAPGRDGPGRRVLRPHVQGDSLRAHR